MINDFYTNAINEESKQSSQSQEENSGDISFVEDKT